MKAQKLVEGGKVRVQGYEFIVTNLRIHPADGCKEAFARFTGVCTDNPVNDSIRNTSYNGGTYGGNRFAGYTW
jgi:hypothetical protein